MGGATANASGASQPSARAQTEPSLETETNKGSGIHIYSEYVGYPEDVLGGGGRDGTGSDGSFIIVVLRHGKDPWHVLN